jgi:methylated-DNA-protein-cysteine methyltransferase-like protein
VSAGPDRFFARVYALVRGIPPGHVASYGEVAALLGVNHGARAVGWALRALRGAASRRVPWHRVLGAGGRISLPDAIGGREQRRRLRAEGVRFTNGRVDLARHGLLGGASYPATRARKPRRSMGCAGDGRVSVQTDARKP